MGTKLVEILARQPARALLITTLLLVSPLPAVADSHCGSASDKPVITSIWQATECRDWDKLPQVKWKFQATWFAIGDPVHETLTELALQRAGIEKKTAEYVRGVLWNDDPCALLLDRDNDADPLEPQLTGFDFVKDFWKAQEIAKRGSNRFGGMDCPLLGRSHFGDFQFLHAMAAADGLSAETTLTRMLGWSEFAYRVAIKDIYHRDRLHQASGSPAMKELLASLPDQQIQALFIGNNGEQITRRALGSLLHILQDSYPLGHTLRDDSNGKIRQFYSYARQDHGKHSEDDEWKHGKDIASRIANTPRASDALDASTALLQLFARRAKWEAVREFLENGPFALHAETLDSGPGTHAGL